MAHPASRQVIGPLKFPSSSFPFSSSLSSWFSSTTFILTDHQSITVSYFLLLPLHPFIVCSTGRGWVVTKIPVKMYNKIIYGMIQRNVFFLLIITFWLFWNESSHCNVFPQKPNEFRCLDYFSSFYLLFSCETLFLTPFWLPSWLPSVIEEPFLRQTPFSNDVSTCKQWWGSSLLVIQSRTLKSAITSYSELNPRNILQEEALTPCLIDGSERKKSSFFGMRFWFNN